MSRTLRLATVIAVLATMLVFTPKAARACTCAHPNPHEWLARADAAFVGKVIAVPDEELRGERGGIEGDYLFQVDQAVKGDLPETITVRSPIDGAACGLGQGVGVTTGVFLRLVDGHWTTNSCSRIAADVLLAAAEPLPAPDGEGPIVALASIITPEGRTIALDAKGRTLAYGAGTGEVRAYALCPGAQRVVEHVFDPTDDGPRYRIAARDLRGFHVVREIASEDVPATHTVADIACLDPAGDEILLFALWDQSDRRNGRIVRVRGDTIETVIEFPIQADCSGNAAFDMPNKLAYFTGGPDCRVLYRHDLGTAETTEIAGIPETSVSSPWIAGLLLSPDGRYLAIEEHPGPRRHTFRLMIADLQADPVSFIEGVYRSGDFGAGNFWLSDDRILLSGPAHRGQSLVINSQLEAVATIDDLPAGPGGIQGDDIYVIAFGGKFASAPATGGQARELRDFLAPEVHAFMVLPAGIEYDPAARQPDNLAAVVDTQIAPSSEPVEQSDASSGISVLTIGILALAVGAGLLLAGLIARVRFTRGRSRLDPDAG